MRFILFVGALALLRHSGTSKATPLLKHLNGVNSIACLKELQANPDADCKDDVPAAPKTEMSSSTTSVGGKTQQHFIGAKGFPIPFTKFLHNGENVCRDGNEYFCDPEDVLTTEQQESIVTHLRNVRQNTLVTCPIPAIRGRFNSPNVPREEDEFNFILGVALLKNLPSEEQSEDSLQKFGEMLLDTWGIESDCDRSSILIIVTEPQLFWLASKGCRFACGQDEETGRRVVNALSSAGDNWEANLEAGITTMVDVISEHKEAHRVAHIQDDHWAAYLRRKEAAWAKYETSVYWLVGVPFILCFLKLLSWLWGVGQMSEKTESAAGWLKQSYIDSYKWSLGWTVWFGALVFTSIRDSLVWLKDCLVYTCGAITFTLKSCCS